MSDDEYLNWAMFSRIGSALSFGHLQPMTAYGRVDARLKDGDKNFARDEEAISEELTAALKRIAITSARATP